MEEILNFFISDIALLIYALTINIFLIRYLISLYKKEQSLKDKKHQLENQISNLQLDNLLIGERK